MSIFISEPKWTLESLKTTFVFFAQKGPITFLGRKSDQLITLVLKGQKSDRRFEKWFHWFQKSKNLKMHILKNSFTKESRKSFFAHLWCLHKDRCAKNSSLLSWWQPTTQLKMPKSQKSSERCARALVYPHHIGVQTRGISDRVRSTGIPNGWVSTEN